MQCHRRIILVGKTGYGRSSIANSILQRDAFTQELSAKALTKTSFVEKRKSPFNNLEYDVVDTPGLFDTEKSVSERALEIQRSVDICPEPHAFLVVFSAKYHMTKEEKFTTDLLRVIFGECIFNHSIVVFTHGNSFESDLAFEEFWKQNETLVELIKLCGNRVVKIKNTNDLTAEIEGTQNMFKMIENMSDDGEKVYRYTSLKTHRSVIEEHSKNYNGKGGIPEEVSEMVKQIGKKMDTKLWTTMLYAEVLIGSDAVGARYVAGKTGAANSVAASGLGSAVLNSPAAQKQRNTVAMQNQRRIILVGKTGNGKSSTGNSILQRNAFIHRLSTNAVTETSMMESRIDVANNMFYNVVDTPGLLDTKRSVSEKALEIQRSVVDICPEPHAFLIVFSVVNRITEDEQFTIDVLRIMFGEGIFDHSIVVFTHGNMLQSGQAFQQFWGENKVLVNLINRCGNRVVKIDNAYAFPSNNKGTLRIFGMIENMSDAGKRVYRYTGFNIHRSVIEEHLRNYHGNGDIHEELTEIAIRIEEETRRIEEETRRREEKMRNRRVEEEMRNRRIETEMRNRRIEENITNRWIRNKIVAGAGALGGYVALGLVLTPLEDLKPE